MRLSTSALRRALPMTNAKSERPMTFAEGGSALLPRLRNCDKGTRSTDNLRGTKGGETGVPLTRFWMTRSALCVE